MHISDSGFLQPGSIVENLKRGEHIVRHNSCGARILKAFLSNARIITLPDGRRIPIREYVAGWRRLKIMVENPDIKAVGGFCDSPLSPQQTLKTISAGVHDRINQYVFHYNKGRKWTQEYYWQCKRDQRALQMNVTQRVIIRNLETDEARQRFFDRVSVPEDFF